MSETYDDEDLRELCAIDGDWGGTPWGVAILRLLDERDDWRGQVVAIRGQQRAALKRAEKAEQTLGTIADEFGVQARRALEATGPRVIRAFKVVSDEFAKRQHEDFGDEQ